MYLRLKKVDTLRVKIKGCARLNELVMDSDFMFFFLVLLQSGGVKFYLKFGVKIGTIIEGP